MQMTILAYLTSVSDDFLPMFKVTKKFYKLNCTFLHMKFGSKLSVTSYFFTVMSYDGITPNNYVM